MLHAMSGPVYSDDLPTAICTNRKLDGNTPDKLLTSSLFDAESYSEPFKNGFNTESYSVNARYSPGPI